MSTCKGRTAVGKPHSAPARDHPRLAGAGRLAVRHQHCVVHTLRRGVAVEERYLIRRERLAWRTSGLFPFRLVLPGEIQSYLGETTSLAHVRTVPIPRGLLTAIQTAVAGRLLPDCFKVLLPRLLQPCWVFGHGDQALLCASLVLSPQSHQARARLPRSPQDMEVTASAISASEQFHRPKLERNTDAVFQDAVSLSVATVGCHCRSVWSMRSGAPRSLAGNRQ